MPHFRTKCEVVPNGVDLSLFKQKKHKKGKRILFVGRLIYYKGVQYLIRAMPEILKKVPGAELVIVGDGPLMTEMRKLANDLGIGRRVEFIGSIPHSKMPGCINMFDCLVFNDIRAFDNRDLMSMTHCEAMACGAMMLNSAKPRKEWGMKTWVEIKKPDPAEISSKILGVLADDKRYKNLPKNARKVAHDRAVTPASRLLETGLIQEFDASSSVTDEAALLQRARDADHGGPVHAQHCGEGLLGERKRVAPDASLLGQQPAAELVPHGRALVALGADARPDVDGVLLLPLRRDREPGRQQGRTQHQGEGSASRNFQSFPSPHP